MLRILIQGVKKIQGGRVSLSPLQVQFISQDELFPHIRTNEKVQTRIIATRRCFTSSGKRGTEIDSNQKSRRRRQRPTLPLSALDAVIKRKNLQKKASQQDIIVYKEEDKEEMAEFLAEYDALEAEEQGFKGASDPANLNVLEDLEIEETEDGIMRLVKNRIKQSENDHDDDDNNKSAEDLLRKARKAGGMTEDDWFEFLRRIGMQREGPSSTAEEGFPEDADVQEYEKEKPSRRRKNVVKRTSKRKFVDRICISTSGGRGGKGCISFECQGWKGKGASIKKPSGGHGGQGGDVIFVADFEVQTLEMDRHHYHGKKGEDGDSNNRRGARGEPTVVRVPCGTVVKEIRRVSDSADGEAQYKALEVCDLDEPMSYYIAATGGKPGLGNSIQAGKTRRVTGGGHFRAPGQEGEQRYYELELKTIADVGLVGYPNAGKSTLLGSLSRARPKVAAYPFTTLHPTVGRVEFTDAMNLTVADLPGLIEGAHANKGLGHEFLRHIERTKVLLYVLDGFGPFSGKKGSSRQQQEQQQESLAIEPAHIVYQKLKEELELYCPGLSDKPSLIWINKYDLNPDSVTRAMEEVKEVILASAETTTARTPLIFMGSAMKGDRVGALAKALRQIVEGTAGPSRRSPVDSGGASSSPSSWSPAAGEVVMSAAAGDNASLLSLAQGYAEALNQTQQEQAELAQTMAHTMEVRHRARCYAAALEVVRRHNIYMARAMDAAQTTKMTGLKQSS